MIPFHSALVEAASWRIATELCRRSPELSIYQYFPGGGQNDCLALMHPGLGIVADLNRSGTFHVRACLDGAVARDDNWDVWREVGQTPPRDFVDAASARIGQSVPARLPSSTPRIIVYRAIAAILTLHAFACAKWTCQGASIDTPGFGSGSHPALARFPVAKAALRTLEAQVSAQVREGIWIVLRDEDPMLCLRENGEVWRLDGGTDNVVNSYRRTRRIASVILPLLNTDADL